MSGSQQSPRTMAHPNADVEAGEGNETPQPLTARIVEGFKAMVAYSLAVVGDYKSLYTGLLPWNTDEPLTREKYCQTLPLSVFVLWCWVFLFLIVETSGGAGGTSGVGGVRIVMIFFIVMVVLFPSAIYIAHTNNPAHAGSANGAQQSNFLSAFFLMTFLTLSASVGSAWSTFGIDYCWTQPSANWNATEAEDMNLSLPLRISVGPVFDSDGVGFRGDCGMDSKLRGAKTFFEILFYLIFGMPV
eukprot:CAMPEP_0114131902 /NCGR_PEP_ID=MMETSP0043_2-20121206/12803_1 /TAXON_ID=464988 /ORGANISM="Hemiselmis andersenii, Strain CCMP644" /LENGTH=243 /DNA_ID=CAMNT_0001225369 /DNA_START=203 /DNA_END=930 /DNA_ORIENTATION=+